MRRILTCMSPFVLLLAVSAAQADSGKIHVCRAAGSTSTAKSVEIPAGSSFSVGDSAHHVVKTTADAKLGAKCASIDATSASDPEAAAIKQGKTPLTAQFSLPGITLEGTVSRTFKPSAGATPAATKTAASKAAAPAPAPAATPAAAPTPAAPAAPAAPARTAAKASTAASAGSGSSPTISDAAAPAGSTAKCKDGTYSKSQHHSGTCSHHGGVADWLTQ